MTPADRLPVEPGDRVLGCMRGAGRKGDGTGGKASGTGVLAANDLSSSRAKGLFKEPGTLRYRKCARAQRGTGENWCLTSGVF